MGVLKQMVKIKIQSIGQHQSKDIIEVDEKKATELVMTGNYQYIAGEIINEEIIDEEVIEEVVEEQTEEEIKEE